MVAALRSCAALAFAALGVSCNEVHFANDANVDFSRYQVAAVAVTARADVSRPVPHAIASEFVEEIRRLGDFRRVLGPSDPLGSQDLMIVASIVDVDTTSESSWTDDHCDVALELTVRAEMTATDATGRTVYHLEDVEEFASDTETGLNVDGTCLFQGDFSSGELEDLYEEAVADALDTIAAFFLTSFDI